MSLESWISYFQEVSGLLKTAERHYSVADADFSGYMIERLELVIQSCQTAACSVSLDETEQTVIDDYKGSVEELIGHSRLSLDKWKEYRT